MVLRQAFFFTGREDLSLSKRKIERARSVCAQYLGKRKRERRFWVRCSTEREDKGNGGGFKKERI